MIDKQWFAVTYINNAVVEVLALNIHKAHEMSHITGQPIVDIKSLGKAGE